ncbi:adenosylcobinamide amidohydrolase [Candidatus Pyrohabitans sp.]
MNWKVVEDTLIIEGRFYALSSGLLGGSGRVRYLFNHRVEEDELGEPVAYLKSVAERFGMSSYFGLLTSVSMDKLSVVEEGDVVVFATAGVENHNRKIGTINIILVLEGDMPAGAMVNGVITATEAKSVALLESGLNFTGTSTDAVIVAKTGRGRYYEYSGPASELGSRVWKAVGEAVKNSLMK